MKTTTMTASGIGGWAALVVAFWSAPAVGQEGASEALDGTTAGGEAEAGDAVPASEAAVSPAGGGAEGEPEAGDAVAVSEVEEAAAEEEDFVQVRAIGEFGFLAALSHTVQFSNSGTEFDYVGEGGQDTLFPAGRVSAELELGGAHNIVFLYQPLNLETQVLLGRDVVVDEATFPEGSALNLRYGFDFYRLSYAYDFFGEYPQHELSLGLSLQIRNAVINFTSVDGETRRTNRDVGPVPVIKLRGKYTWDNGLWVGGEVDGFYAPIKYLNGGDSDVEGAIIDLSARVGYRIHPAVNAFLNVRYLAGGASGTSEPDGPGDGYVANWLHFLTVTMGFELNFNRLL